MFDVAFGPANAAVALPEQFETCVAHGAHGALDSDTPHQRVADHALATPNVLATGFELRFDERDEQPADAQDLGDGSDQFLDANEGSIDRDPIDRFVEVTRHEVSCIDAIAAHHPWIASQLVGELPLAYIDGVNPGGAALQQAISESTRRCPNVDAHRSRRTQRQVLERPGQFLATARDEGLTLANGELDFHGQLHTGFVDPPITSEHTTSHDEGLSLVPRHAEAFFDQQNINT
jgi:hypothetical protein